MSWSLNVGSQIPKADFDVAVDAAIASPALADGDPNAAKYEVAVATAKDALKTFAAQIGNDFLSASASGHVAGEGTYPYDTLNASVSGTAPPEPAAETPAEAAEAAEESAAPAA